MLEAITSSYKLYFAVVTIIKVVNKIISDSTFIRRLFIKNQAVTKIIFNLDNNCSMEKMLMLFNLNIK